MLETSRLLLRQFTEKDFPAFATMMANKDVTRFINMGQAMDSQQAWRTMAAILGHWQLRGYGLWAVEEKASGRFVGRVGLINPEGWPGLELAWALDRPFWGQGYATEAAIAAGNWAFRELACDKLISLIDPDNESSRRLAQGLGQHCTGEVEVMGQLIDLYEVNSSNWSFHQ